MSVSFPNAPAGITIPVTAIFANDIIIKCQAGRDVEPKKYEIEVVGTGPKAPDGNTPKASKKFNLTVKPFDPSIRPPLDIVFVLDVTQSLDAQIAGVSQGIGQFLKGLKDRDLDARVGLLAFRDIIYDDVPDFEKLKFNGELFTKDAKAFAAEVAKLKAQGGGDLPESSLDAIVKAANEYPFRANAQKNILADHRRKTADQGELGDDGDRAKDPARQEDRSGAFDRQDGGSAELSGAARPGERRREGGLF